MDTHTVSVSVDGLRQGITNDLEELGQFLKQLIDDGDLCSSDSDEVIRLFDQAACGINSFNCVHSPDDKGFNLLENLEVTHLGNYD